MLNDLDEQGQPSADIPYWPKLRPNPKVHATAVPTGACMAFLAVGDMAYARRGL
jgi:hypothetical protein